MSCVFCLLFKKLADRSKTSKTSHKNDMYYNFVWAYPCFKTFDYPKQHSKYCAQMYLDLLITSRIYLWHSRWFKSLWLRSHTFQLPSSPICAQYILSNLCLIYIIKTFDARQILVLFIFISTWNVIQPNNFANLPRVSESTSCKTLDYEFWKETQQKWVV